MTDLEYQTLNIFFNLLEYSYSRMTIDDLWWLYFGLMSDSMAFNIVEYLFDRFGLIK